MARLLDTDISQRDIEEFLETQDDFALEMFVYRVASEIGANPRHGGTYTDPVTLKPRQFDVRVNFERSNHRISLAIECKALRKSFPLLVSRIPRTADESYHELIATGGYVPGMSMLVDGTTRTVPASKVVRVIGDRSLYRLGELVGKSTAQVGRLTATGDLTSNDGEAYEKWSQALASATDLAFAARSIRRDKDEEPIVVFVLPILVVPDDTLWVADYDDDGALFKKPTRAPEATIYVERSYGGAGETPYTVSHLQVMTRSRIETYLRTFAHADAGSHWVHVFNQTVLRAEVPSYRGS
jgi:hypothetical protein